MLKSKGFAFTDMGTLKIGQRSVGRWQSEENSSLLVNPCKSSLAAVGFSLLERSWWVLTLSMALTSTKMLLPYSKPILKVREVTTNSIVTLFLGRLWDGQCWPCEHWCHRHGPWLETEVWFLILQFCPCRGLYSSLLREKPPLKKLNFWLIL